MVLDDLIWVCCNFLLLLVLCDFGMGLLGLWYVCFGSGFLLILVWIDLVDFGRNGFGHWACGMDGFGCCLAGSMERRGRLSGRQ